MPSTGRNTSSTCPALSPLDAVPAAAVAVHSRLNRSQPAAMSRIGWRSAAVSAECRRCRFASSTATFGARVLTRDWFNAAARSGREARTDSAAAWASSRAVTTSVAARAVSELSRYRSTCTRSPPRSVRSSTACPDLKATPHSTRSPLPSTLFHRRHEHRPAYRRDRRRQRRDLAPPQVGRCVAVADRGAPEEPPAAVRLADVRLGAAR